jgi:hypothetical protein
LLGEVEQIIWRRSKIPVSEVDDEADMGGVPYIFLEVAE